MKRYTVVWKASALDQLAEVWLQAPDRRAVTTATAQVDSFWELTHSAAEPTFAKGFEWWRLSPRE
jgi:hypothetical protein